MPPPDGRPDEPPAEASAVAAAHEPFFRITTWGERIGVVGMLVLILGSFLPWGGPPLAEWGPLAVTGRSLIPLTLGVLALMQLGSTASHTGNVVMLGLASVGGLAAVGAKAFDGLAEPQVWGLGVPVALLGTALSLVAMEVQRREAGLQYVNMGLRALELVMQPRVQIALLKLFIPFALVGLFVLFILEGYGQEVANKLGATFVLYFFNPVGKEVGIPFALSGAVEPAIDPALTWGFIVFVDIVTALFLVWNFDHVLKVPYFGRFLAWVERRGNAAVVKYKWIGRLAFFGLVTYATLPLEGTGAIGGSVVGRAIGLTAFRTFLAVGVGSVIRTSATTLIVLGAFRALGF